ncbi:DUF433 domain-containing protein [Sphingobium sp. R-7]|uniref:DUF433 domain-containing protein n=1 Tax=Sphingobium sp. R-7 TaxID=3375449 RepID=UPI00398A53D8
MPAAARLFTPSEAAAVTGIGVKAVNNAIDKRIVKAAKPAPGARPARRALTADDLLRVKLWYKVGDILSQERRERLFDAIREQPKARTVKADDLLIIDVGEARKQIAARTRDLEAAEAMVGQDKDVMGGEPVFKGTRIPVRLIASMLAEGADADEILEGYPKLNERQLELARIWVAAHPRRGRPKSLKDRGFKLKSVKRTMLRRAPRSSGTSATR